MKCHSIGRLISLCLAFILLLIPIYPSHALTETVFYVAPGGNDSFNGSRSAPFATLAKAIRTLPDDGGTIVVTGRLNSGVTILDASATANHKTGGELLITGRDPFSGTVYPDAGFSFNSPRIYVPTTLEYLKISPTRNYAFFNTFGTPLAFGEGITSSDYPLYIHSGASGNMSTDGNTLTVGSGDFEVVYLGGAYLTDSRNGVNGDCDFTITGGTVKNLWIGFDATGTSNAEGIITGNVVIRHTGGTINNLKTRLLKDHAIGGYFAYIAAEGVSPSFEDLPNAAKGSYFIYVGKHGKVIETETAGLFTVLPQAGYTAFINGVRNDEQSVVLPVGTSYVDFRRDAVEASFTGTYIGGGEDGSFRPDDPATRIDAMTALFSIIDHHYEPIGNDGFLRLSEAFALPNGWNENSGEQGVTRGELVYLLYTFFETSHSISRPFDFADVPDNHPYAEAILYAASSGYLAGREGEYFHPDEVITRAELCGITSAFLGRIAYDDAECTFDDTHGHPLEDAVITGTTSAEEDMWYYGEKTYRLPENADAETAIKALYEQAEHLSGKAILDAADTISLAMRENILSTPNTADLYDFNELGITKVYYISEKNGKDSNDGLSPETAFRTPAAIFTKTVKKNAAFLFERGGVYRTGTNTIALNGSNNVLFGSYGEGDKPLLIQSQRNYAEVRWTKVADNIYRCPLMVRNVGVMAFDHDITDYSDATYAESYGIIANKYTQGFTGIEDLSEDFQFYCDIPSRLSTNRETTMDGTVKVTTETVSETFDRFDLGYLYLYSAKGNPSLRFRSIEIGENYNIFGGAGHGCIIDNLSLKYTGAHSIGLGTSENITVTNCIFSWLGGSILWEASRTTTKVIRDDGSAPEVKEEITEATCYGNGVEIFGSCNGFHVYNCWLYQIFDDGLTNQYTQSDKDATHKDVRFCGNLIEYLYHSFSNTNAGTEKQPSTDFEIEGPNAVSDYTVDYRAMYNVSRMSGYGWGGAMKQRVNNGMLYRSYTPGYNRDEWVEYNIFDTSGGYVSYANNSHEVFDKNIYANILGHRTVCNVGVKTTDYTLNAHRDIKNAIGDQHGVTVLIMDEETAIDRMFEQKAARGETDSFRFIGAQIRTQGPQALRFVFSIDKALYQKLLPDDLPKGRYDTDIGFGAVVMPRKYLGNDKLQKETLTYVDEKWYAPQTVPAVNRFGENADEIHFTVCISGISPRNYGEEYVAVPYITYPVQYGTMTVYGKETEDISLSRIASMAGIDLSE